MTSTVGSVVAGGGWLSGATACARAADGSTTSAVAARRRGNVRPDIFLPTAFFSCSH